MNFFTRIASSPETALINAGYRYALSLTHNLHDAEDLIQQACLQAYQSRGKLINQKYLFVIIRHLFYDQLRKQKRTQHDELPPETLLSESSPNTTNQIEHQDTIDYFLSCLRPEERELLFLNCAEGMTAAEISELTGQPRGTILSTLSRAKKKITSRHQMTPDR